MKKPDRPVILVSNDDGIHAPGIVALASALEAVGEVWVVAPDRERSAVGHALTLVHSQPANDWTIESLASAVGMSRSAFAKRFAHFSGDSPMQYLARWRMQLAARRLENPQVSIAQVGVEVGYESEAAFNRAFKKVVGVPPGMWRRGRSSEAAQTG